VVVARPKSSQRQEETKAGQQQEEPRTVDAAESDDDVLEEIEGHPQDGRQHVYVCRQRGDHLICHEEISTEDETRKVELATKRLIAEV
jgi:ferredoxin